MSVFRLTDGADAFPSVAEARLVAGDDVVTGLAGHDSLNGGLGRDSVYGGFGNDTLVSLWRDEPDTGADLLVGGRGNDVIFALGSLTGEGLEDDTVFGGAGNDVIYGGVSVSGGAGHDEITVATGAAFVFGDEGDDLVTARCDGLVPQRMTLSGGTGHDVLSLTVGADPVAGMVALTARGVVWIDGVARVDVSQFETFVLRTDAHDVALRGGRESNLLYLGGDGGRVQTGAGRDVVTVDYSQRFDGGAFDLNGGAGGDVLAIIAEVQNGVPLYVDWLTGFARIGGQGSSRFQNFERLEVLGTAGNDTVYASAGDDLINGSFGDDKLVGKEGADTLTGGFGADTLAGGNGADVFVYQSEFDAQGAGDLILRFQAGDRIDLSGIDAGSATDGFAFVGQAAFSGAAQVRVEQVGADARVTVNTDADLQAEMVIVLVGFQAATLAAGDFSL